MSADLNTAIKNRNEIKCHAKFPHHEFIEIQFFSLYSFDFKKNKEFHKKMRHKSIKITVKARDIQTYTKRR